jgi:methylmalonyl-CoA mutase cobalamin-binding subunit
VTYLGANLPAEDIAAAAVRTEARVVALSLVYPPDDVHVHQELQRLRRVLPKPTRIVVGGRAAVSYDVALKAIGAERVSSMAEFRSRLRDHVTQTRARA